MFLYDGIPSKAPLTDNGKTSLKRRSNGLLDIVAALANGDTVVKVLILGILHHSLQTLWLSPGQTHVSSGPDLPLTPDP